MTTPRITPLLFAAPALLFGALWLHAGPLNPPAGPVTSSYKTLSEVEPRIAINAANTPGDAASLYRITLPGSYYLTGNVSVSGKHGIAIATSDVTIDLNGFELLGPGVAGAFDGIRVTAASVVNTAIVNGSVRSWGGSGIDLSGSNAFNCRVERIQAAGNSLFGITVGRATTLVNCESYNNAGTGIGTGVDCSLNQCSASNNSGTGISCTDGCSVINCRAYSNNGNGISVGSGSTIADCTVRSNLGDSILCASYCLVRSNNCSTSISGAGIHATNRGNRIEANACSGNATGVSITFLGNTILRNTCTSNTTNWSIVANNICGPILDRTAPASALINGNAGPSSLGSTEPNANFTY